MTQYEQVREFMLMFGQECPSEPCLPSESIRKLRVEMIQEERNELFNARSDVERFDAILDLSYVVVGAFIAFGFTEDDMIALPRGQSHDDLDKLLFSEDILKVKGALQSYVWWIERNAEFYELNQWTMEKGFSEVHRSNMSKLWNAVELDSEHFKQGYSAHATYWVGGNRYIVKDASGKIIKSPSYSPANLRPILEVGV